MYTQYGMTMERLFFAMLNLAFRLAKWVVRIACIIVFVWMVPRLWKLMKWVLKGLWKLSKAYLPPAWRWVCAKVRNYFAVVRENNRLMPLDEREREVSRQW